MDLLNTPPNVVKYSSVKCQKTRSLKKETNNGTSISSTWLKKASYNVSVQICGTHYARPIYTAVQLNCNLHGLCSLLCLSVNPGVSLAIAHSRDCLFGQEAKFSRFTYDGFLQSP